MYLIVVFANRVGGLLHKQGFIASQPVQWQFVIVESSRKLFWFDFHLGLNVYRGPVAASRLII